VVEHSADNGKAVRFDSYRAHIVEPKIIYEDKDIVVVNKPAGLLVHAGAARRAGKFVKGKGVKTGKKKEVVFHAEPTLVDWLLARYPEMKTVGDDPRDRPGIVHRLDKDTSGVMVVARNQAAFAYLKSLFLEHRISKTYYAIVFGVPKKGEGIIDLPIGIKNGTLKRSVQSKKMQKEAVTAYRVLKTFEAPGARGGQKGFSLLEVRPKTGRTHQIRVHLAHLGHAVVGDPIYGPEREPPWASRLMLQAVALEFRLPDGTMMKFEAEGDLEIRIQNLETRNQ
jgi:23S rRNA pseudouridine1911/1915/1917 synthase